MAYDTLQLNSLLSRNTSSWLDLLGGASYAQPDRDQGRNTNWLDFVNGGQSPYRQLAAQMRGQAQYGGSPWAELQGSARSYANSQSARSLAEFAKALATAREGKAGPAIVSPPIPGATETYLPTGGGNSAAGTGAGKWKALAESLAPEYNVPVDVVLGIIEIESGGDPGAIGKHTGDGQAQGLMQVMPFHWPDGTPEQVMRDPVRNMQKGIGILKNNYAVFGDWDRAVAAYFGAIDPDTGQITAWKDANGVDGFEYVRRFNAARGNYASLGGGGGAG